MRLGIVRADKPEEEHRHKHTAACTDDRKKCLLRIVQFSDAELTLDLKSHRKEEYGHQEVIDDLHESHRVTVVAEKVELTYRQ